MNEDITIVRIGNIYGPNFGTGYAGNVWDKRGLCPALTCVSAGGNRQLMIIVEKKPKLISKQTYIVSGGSKAHIKDKVDISPTLLARQWKGLNTYGMAAVVEVWNGKRTKD